MGVICSGLLSSLYLLDNVCDLEVIVNSEIAFEAHIIHVIKMFYNYLSNLAGLRPMIFRSLAENEFHVVPTLV